MQTFFSINTVFFTVMGYPMSYIEFFGTIFNIACVWLVARNKILNWPVGIIGTTLFGILFWQVQLYSDVLEQIYFLITGFWGWYAWSSYAKKTSKKDDVVSGITSLSLSSWGIWTGLIIVGTIALGYISSHLYTYFPLYFPLPASFAYLDAFTTVLSFSATILMIKRVLDSWYLWILVDVIGIWLYWVKGVHFISLLYVAFLLMATQGLFIWLKLKNNSKK